MCIIDGGVSSLGTTTYRSLHIQDTSMKSMLQELALQRKDFAKNALEFRDLAKRSTFRSRVQVLFGDEGRLTRECKAVLYWMWRDMRSFFFSLTVRCDVFLPRVQDNWALLHAQAVALELRVPLHVVVKIC